MSLIPARSHTFVEIDREIFSTVILLLRLIQEGQSLLSVARESMCTNSMVRLTEHYDMTIAVDWDIKPQTKLTKNQRVVGPDPGPNIFFQILTENSVSKQWTP